MTDITASPSGDEFQIGSTVVSMTATDVSGNQTTCTMVVLVEGNSSISITCPADLTVSTDPGGSCVATLTLPEPIVATNCGTSFITSNAPNTFPVGMTVVVFTASDFSGNTASCSVAVTVEGGVNVLQGTVFLDEISQNCSLDAGETRLQNQVVKAIGQTTKQVYSAKTDAQGRYEITSCDVDTVFEVSLDLPFNFGKTCQAIYLVKLPAAGQPAVQDLPVVLENDCPLLSIDLATPRIRPCFTDIYTVSYCNLGLLTVENAHVTVTLDENLAFKSSSIPATDLGGNTFDFQLGDLAAGFCGNFKINFFTKCDAPVGTTHCSSARIFPDTICGGWSGATLEANARCDGDSVRLSMRNIGKSGMSQSLDFVVVEDLIMYMTLPTQLGAGEQFDLALPADGSVWRIQSRQETGHPWSGWAADFVEGCGGNSSQAGVALAMAVGNSNPFEATDCVVSVASYDPNDKTAVPTGYGAQNLIEKNTEIEYSIRFQNTGTDTAFSVVILDTLPSNLDIQTVRPGASTHDFDFDILTGNVLRFRFDGINLPDSAANFEASQGLVKFKIQQKKDLPDGTLLANRAAIFFDFNAPILTDFATHRVGSNFIVVETDEPDELAKKLKIYPNPSVAAVNFELEKSVSAARFSLSDSFGRLVFEHEFSGNRYRFERGGLAAGVYFFQILTDGVEQFSGRVILK